MKKAVPSQGVTPTLVGDETLRHWQRRDSPGFSPTPSRAVLDTSNRFVKAARELLRETGDLSFTIREVVTQSKMSVRDFYKTFASKDDLMLALFEEYCAGAGRVATSLHDGARGRRRADPRIPRRGVGRQASSRCSAGPRHLWHDPVVDPPRRFRARSNHKSWPYARWSSAALPAARCATTSGAAGWPRSSCTPASPPRRKRSCDRATRSSRPSGRSASVVSAINLEASRAAPGLPSNLPPNARPTTVAPACRLVGGVRTASSSRS